MCEYSPRLLDLAQEPQGIKVSKMVLDEEKPFPIDDESLDLVVSNLKLVLGSSIVIFSCQVFVIY